jgi:glycosyltransferase involved in cell wall biosynthesis
MSTVLMVAFHYPPCAVGSGINRTLKFSRYLPDAGWRPVVLTAHPRAYVRTRTEQLAEIPRAVTVVRAPALEARRHLAWRGSYLRWTALPDDWWTWWLGAVPAGLRLVRSQRARVIWSTYPIATAHLIGLTLHRLTGLPWVADFRDSMTEDAYPRDPVQRRAYLWIERRVVARAARIVFTAEATRRMYLARYPALAPERCAVIPNGYDEADFEGLVADATRAEGRPLRLLHSGVIYPEERDPRPFFRALARLKREGRVSARDLQVDLRASGFEHEYTALLTDLRIGDIVRLLPPIPYREALRECLAADALLLLQGASCNHQIPAKAYEYLRARKPILALAAPDGDTAALLREHGGFTLAELDNEDAIRAALPPFLEAVRTGSHPLPDAKRVEAYARHSQALVLSRLLSEVCAPGGRRTC